MTQEEVNKFNELSEKICEELLEECRCYSCPFSQYDNSMFDCCNQIQLDEYGKIELKVIPPKIIIK